MRNSKNKARCEKRKVAKCDEVLRTYSLLQSEFADNLAEDETVKSFRCNVPLTDFPIGDTYTTDFVITKTDGDLAVRECVYRAYITKPQNVKLLTASFEYWSRRGVKDWGIVSDAE